MDPRIVAPISVRQLVFDLGVALVLSLVIAGYYTRYGRSLSNRTQFAHIFPMLTLITVLVISVVKSSLALSLGLVGALSIVRFRTAIKDPEELIYLFFAIAVGLGMGAGQRIVTIIATLFVLIYLGVRVIAGRARRSHPQNFYLNVTYHHNPDSTILPRINALLKKHVKEADLRRLDSNNGDLQAAYYLAITDPDTLNALSADLTSALPGCSLSFIERNNLLGG